MTDAEREKVVAEIEWLKSCLQCGLDTSLTKAIERRIERLKQKLERGR